MMAENMPALPPAWTNHRPLAANFGQDAPANPSGRPSLQPPAPRTSSSPGSVNSDISSSRSRAFDHPPSRNTRACSGDTTMKASNTNANLGCATDRRPKANDRASDSGVRDTWSTMPRVPSAANRVTADTPDVTPRSTDNGSHGESSSSSAKQNVYLPGLPSVARSTPPGLPPPTFRTTNCSARPMVALARLP